LLFSLFAAAAEPRFEFAPRAIDMIYAAASRRSAASDFIDDALFVF